MGPPPARLGWLAVLLLCGLVLPVWGGTIKLSKPFNSAKSTYVQVVGLSETSGIVCYVYCGDKCKARCSSLLLNKDGSITSFGDQASPKSKKNFAEVNGFKSRFTTVTNMGSTGGIVCYVSADQAEKKGDMHDAIAQVKYNSAFCRYLRVDPKSHRLIVGPAKAVNLGSTVTMSQVKAFDDKYAFVCYNRAKAAKGKAKATAYGACKVLKLDGMKLVVGKEAPFSPSAIGVSPQLKTSSASAPDIGLGSYGSTAGIVLYPSATEGKFGSNAGFYSLLLRDGMSLKSVGRKQFNACFTTFVSGTSYGNNAVFCYTSGLKRAGRAMCSLFVFDPKKKALAQSQLAITPPAKVTKSQQGPDDMPAFQKYGDNYYHDISSSHAPTSAAAAPVKRIVIAPKKRAPTHLKNAGKKGHGCFNEGGWKESTGCENEPLTDGEGIQPKSIPKAHFPVPDDRHGAKPLTKKQKAKVKLGHELDKAVDSITHGEDKELKAAQAAEKADDDSIKKPTPAKKKAPSKKTKKTKKKPFKIHHAGLAPPVRSVKKKISIKEANAKGAILPGPKKSVEEMMQFGTHIHLDHDDDDDEKKGGVCAVPTGAEISEYTTVNLRTASNGLMCYLERGSDHARYVCAGLDVKATKFAPKAPKWHEFCNVHTKLHHVKGKCHAYKRFCWLYKQFDMPAEAKTHCENMKAAHATLVKAAKKEVTLLQQELGAGRRLLGRGKKKKKVTTSTKMVLHQTKPEITMKFEQSFDASLTSFGCTYIACYNDWGNGNKQTAAMVNDGDKPVAFDAKSLVCVSIKSAIASPGCKATGIQDLKEKKPAKKKKKSKKAAATAAAQMVKVQAQALSKLQAVSSNRPTISQKQQKQEDVKKVKAAASAAAAAAVEDSSSEHSEVADPEENLKKLDTTASEVAHSVEDLRKQDARVTPLEDFLQQSEILPEEDFAEVYGKI